MRICFATQSPINVPVCAVCIPYECGCQEFSACRSSFSVENLCRRRFVYQLCDPDPRCDIITRRRNCLKDLVAQSTDFCLLLCGSAALLGGVHLLLSNAYFAVETGTRHRHNKSDVFIGHGYRRSNRAALGVSDDACPARIYAGAYLEVAESDLRIRDEVVKGCFAEIAGACTDTLFVVAKESSNNAHGSVHWRLLPRFEHERTSIVYDMSGRSPFVQDSIWIRCKRRRTRDLFKLLPTLTIIGFGRLSVCQ